MQRELAFVVSIAIFAVCVAKDPIPYDVLKEELAKQDTTISLPPLSEFGRRLAILLIQLIAETRKVKDGFTEAVDWPFEGFIAVHRIQEDCTGDQTSNEMIGVFEMLQNSILQNMTVQVNGHTAMLLQEISTMRSGGLTLYTQDDENFIVMYFYKISIPDDQTWRLTYEELREAMHHKPNHNVRMPEYDPTLDTKAAEFAAEQALVFLLNQHPIPTNLGYILETGIQISAVVTASNPTKACEEGMAALADIISKQFLCIEPVTIFVSHMVEEANHAALHIVELPGKRSLYTVACHFAISKDNTKFWSKFQD